MKRRVSKWAVKIAETRNIVKTRTFWVFIAAVVAAKIVTTYARIKAGV
mgnify:CR=1 FL=1